MKAFLNLSGIRVEEALVNDLTGVNRIYDDEGITSGLGAGELGVVGLECVAQWGMIITQIDIWNLEAASVNYAVELLAPAFKNLTGYTAASSTCRLRNRGIAGGMASVRGQARSWLAKPASMTSVDRITVGTRQLAASTSGLIEVPYFVDRYSALSVRATTAQKHLTVTFSGLEFLTKQQRDLYIAAQQ